jgi:signal transduction histidine kinase
LGLAITRSIVEEAGGRIFASNRPQGGARFSLELPVSNARG